MEIKHLDHPTKEHIPFFIEHWKSTNLAISGECIDLMKSPVFLAAGPNLMGLLSYRIKSNTVQILALSTEEPNQGIGSMLLEAIEAFAHKNQSHEVCLIITNDNLQALGFYQHRGYELRVLYPNAVQYSRLLKQEIPLESNGIPIRDELLLSKGIKLKLDHFYQKEVFHVKHAIMLRPFDTITYVDLIQLYSDPKVLRYQAMAPLQTEKDAKAYYIRVCQRIQQEKRLVRGIFVENQFAGIISLHQIHNHQCALGYSLMPDYWNQGITTDAAITMIRLAIERLGIRRVQAITHPDNIASIRLLERLRFHQEGTLIDYIQNPRTGLFENRETHALLAKNFK